MLSSVHSLHHKSETVVDKEETGDGGNSLKGTMGIKGTELGEGKSYTT